MKYLNYQTKNEEGKIVAIRYFPSDEELREISNIILAARRPAEIDFRGQILHTRNIEILDESDLRQKSSYCNLDDSNWREEVRTFEDIFLAWAAGRLPESKTFQYYLADGKVISLSGNPRSCASGKKRYDSFSEAIVKPMEYADLSSKWYGLNELRWRREMAERNNQGSLSEIKEQYPIASQVEDPEEINVVGMFS